MDDPDALLTTRQLQDLLRIDRTTVYRMLADGRLQGFKVGGTWRFRRSAIDDWLQRQQAGTGLPEARATSYEPEDAPEGLPLSCVQAIQDIFAEALGLASVATTPDGLPLTGISNSCDFCSLILNTEPGKTRCVSSWRAAAKEIESEAGRGDALSTLRSPRIATCHAGLSYLWSPIVVEGRLLAITHAGQFLDRPPDRKQWAARLEEIAAATDLGVQQLEGPLARVPIIAPQLKQRLPSLVQRVTATFAEVGQERLGLLRRLHRIAEITQL